jgi:methionine sulfoxide reductase catalytic subunit
MLIKLAAEIASSEVTPKNWYLRRREFLQAMGLSAAAALASVFGIDESVRAAQAGDHLPVTKTVVTTTDRLTPLRDVTTYNNFWEFGSEKADPERNSRSFKSKPWSVTVEGNCGKPGVYTLEDILKPHPLEERIYRMRCVEGWSMVIPWVGFPLGDLLRRFEPTSRATFVEFTTVFRPGEMVGQRGFLQSLPWPYKEGLRMDEAMHPLTIMAVGLYGEALPNQNGAPLRLVVPWKYGFKGIKSIVKVRFAEGQPATTWQMAAPDYYAFYSNVNPSPTNSTFRDQANERRLGEFFMRRTLMFNGYANQVASMYAGMDLRKLY